jgi:hypothetical protein
MISEKSRLIDVLARNPYNICRLAYSKKELTFLLGTIPEALSRSFAFLKQKRLIVEKGNLIIVPDPEKLKFYF